MLLLLSVICLALMVLDIIARAWRVSIVLNAMQVPVPRVDALTLTVFGDAAAALTPWRMGGEPARMFGATHAGVRVSVAIVAMGFDSIVSYLVLIAVAAALAFAFGPEWAAAMRGGARAAVHPAFIAAAAALMVIGLLLVRRLPRHLMARLLEAGRRAIARVRSASPGEVAAMVALSIVSLASRVAILPIVAASFGVRPAAGVITIASFGLLNGQLLVPMPSGAGAVELAAVAGAMGTREHVGAILGTWRVYVTFLPIVLGLGAGALRYGRRAVLTALRRASS